MSAPQQRTTDWQRYYARPFPFARVTRRILAAHITQGLKKYLPRHAPLRIAELGGANSFMYPILHAAFGPAEYHIIDTHPSGTMPPQGRSVHIHQKDVLALDDMPPVDVTLSIGLIEHFSPSDTRKAIHAHMDFLEPDGISVMSFPTPTWLYRASRRLCEWSGTWIFHDERALTTQEVISAASSYGTVLSCDILWPMVLTQAVVVIKKRPAGESAIISPSPAIAQP